MSIKDWPEQERPRERLLKFGANSLSDSELLAIFLRTGVKGLSAVELSRALIIRFGSLSNLIQSDKQHFCKGYGLGEAKYVLLQAVMEMASRCLYQRIGSHKTGNQKIEHQNIESQYIEQPQTLSSPCQTKAYLQSRLQHQKEEVFSVLFMDNRHTPLHFETLFHGTINAASVYPRVVVKRALFHNAAAVIVAHNHPSGSAEPSEADISITHKLADALSLVDIRLLDHFVIGHGEMTSLAEKGLLT